jgi:hypothetical protein
MKGNINFEDWHVVIQTVAFIIISSFFVVVTIRTLLMKKERENALAAMPLDEGDPIVKRPTQPDRN